MNYKITILSEAFQVLIALILIGLGILVYLNKCQPDPPDPAPQETEITAEDIPAQIEYTHTPNNEGSIEYEKAHLDTTLSTPDGQTKVRLGITYDEWYNEFDLDSAITTKPMAYKPKPLKFTGGIGVGFNKGISEADISAGVLIHEKYMISGYAATDQTIGLRFGVIF